jgi:predicted nucleic acid-binding protein
MIVVLDSSAAVELVLSRAGAGSIMNVLNNSDYIISADLFIAEINNVFWKYYNYQNLPSEICSTAIEHAVNLVDDFVPAEDIYKEAFFLSCQISHPVYDSMFLVCARRNDAVLLTLDKKLHLTAEKLSVKSKMF